MDKNYDDWNNLKKSLSKGGSKIFFHEREVWYCSIGKNIGYEEDGKNELFERPILIIKKFNNDIFLSIPLTSSSKDNIYYFKYKLNDREYSGILSQVRLLDRKRLSRKIGMMKESDFKNIINNICNYMP
jgi:mRNA interferase MazF